MININGESVVEDQKLVEKHITVRLQPFIYAFTTNTIPTYLKVGDTFRGVDRRIAEWKKVISKNLKSKNVVLTERYRHPALLSDEIYFRDYSVHQYLLDEIGKKPIEKSLQNLYSKEFFADTTVEDVKDAVKSIEKDFRGNKTKYTYYGVVDNKSATIHGNNDKEWKLRPNQEAVVKNFLAKKDKRELLMYAVMRFGKSFTAMSCALAIQAKKVLIVSAKADVVGEWQKTVETPKCFEGFKFLTDKDLAEGVKISEVLAESEDRKVAIFLTLQNLTGKLEKREDDELKVKPKEVKERLLQVFNEEFDLIIVDETHYGAWASTLGGPLKDKDADGDVIKKERKEYTNFKEHVTNLHTKIKLHLSGTPYNLLYDNKFNNENIIATCQFKDILRDKEKWDLDNFKNIEDGKNNPDTGYPYQEFDNPYFGFPQMLRFAFNLPPEARRNLETAKYDWSLNDLFVTEGEGNDVKFSHESDILTLLKAIDGSEKVDGILGFLDIPKIRDNDVCKHMVFVLPRKHACDAMEKLLNDHKSEFHNLCNYNVLNITGHNLKRSLDTVEKVKAKIEECEKNKEKTITLTVYKMLTGVTVPEWDTMFMLKNTHSAQEYDQAIFRIQNQYIEESVAQDNSVLKIDKKPQTILVDFDPIRMFTFQGLSSRITDNIRNDKQPLEESIKDELNYFPIITYNADKLVKVEPTDLIQLITQYNNDKSIIDSVQSVEFDKGLLQQQEILKYIQAQSSKTTKNKMDTPAHNGEQTSDVQPPDDNGNGGVGYGDSGNQSTNNNPDKDLEKKYRMCIARLCFYSFLTHDHVDGIDDIIDGVKTNCENYNENKRIFDNLELNLPFIEALKKHLSLYFELNVNDVLECANTLSHDKTLTPIKRAQNAIKNFNRFSDSEIVTPNNICDDMIKAIGKDTLAEILNRGEKILDISSKAGEFAFAIYNLLHGYVDEEKLKNGIYSIPTSGTAYEFTRRIYETLGLNVENISDPNKLTAYDLLEKTSATKNKKLVDYDRVKKILTQNKPFSSINHTDKITEEVTDMIKFGAVVGNPPYQEALKNTSDRQIYNLFMDISYELSPLVVMITPSKFLHRAGKTPKAWNDKMLKDNHIKIIKEWDSAKDVFSSTSMSGGVVITLRDKNKEFQPIEFFAISESVESIKNKVLKNTTNSICEILYLQNKFDLTQVYNDYSNLREIIQKEKRIVSSSFIKTPQLFYEKPHNKNDIAIIGVLNSKRVIRYINEKYLDKKENNLSGYKVLISAADGASGVLNNKKAVNIIGKTCILDPKMGYSQTFISFGNFKTKNEAMSLEKYFKSKFARFMIGTLKATNGLKQRIFMNLPLQNFTPKSDIDWSKSIEEIDKQLYKKYALTKDEIAFIESKIKPME